MKIFKALLKPITIAGLFIVLVAADCSNEEPVDTEKISVDFTFEIQVHDSVSIPLPGELVYVDTRKYTGGEVKGVFQYQMSTNSDGWVVKYLGYNFNYDGDYAVFHASMKGYDDYTEPVVHEIVYYNDVKNAANGNDHITYTVTGFLEKTDY
ncbi:MAG: hypothetical protein R2764_14455 [Bacteroidales bacterium]